MTPATLQSCESALRYTIAKVYNREAPTLTDYINAQDPGYSIYIDALRDLCPDTYPQPHQEPRKGDTVRLPSGEQATVVEVGTGYNSGRPTTCIKYASGALAMASPSLLEVLS